MVGIFCTSTVGSWLRCIFYICFLSLLLVFIMLTLKVSLLLFLLFKSPHFCPHEKGERYDISKILMGWENIDSEFSNISVFTLILASKSHLSTTLLTFLLVCLSQQVDTIANFHYREGMTESLTHYHYVKEYQLITVLFRVTFSLLLDTIKPDAKYEGVYIMHS